MNTLRIDFRSLENGLVFQILQIFITNLESLSSIFLQFLMGWNNLRVVQTFAKLSVGSKKVSLGCTSKYVLNTCLIFMFKCIKFFNKTVPKIIKTSIILIYFLRFIMLFSQLAASLLLYWLEFLKSQKQLKTVKVEIPMVCHPLIQQLGQTIFFGCFSNEVNKWSLKWNFLSYINDLEI